ncbi:sigma-70 family RNA polymerase sigma factor [Nodosilinea sp. AN01ver1]|uniref:sigma-70 family RNA polymerase sigma factor n=1 Tax=Nodosilinea sp. AN01ver1 TaxID=3423362 RepID=UPI003D31DDB0
MSDTFPLEQRQTQAEQTVRRFVRRFEPSYHALACHAALPLVLTPELVNYLRNEFLRHEEVPWIAEVDLLLSDLCQPVGYELYAMETDVRAYLLTELERQFGRSRIQQVAKLLISYVRYLAETGASVNEKELEAQQWAAMVYLGGNHRQTAVQQITEKLKASGAMANQVGEELVNPAELARLAQITTELAPKLADYPDLLGYAALVSECVIGDGVVEAEQAERSYEVLPGVELKLPGQLSDQIRRKYPTIQGDSVLASWPPLEDFDFAIAQFIDESLVYEFLMAVSHLLMPDESKGTSLYKFLNRFVRQWQITHVDPHEVIVEGVERGVEYIHRNNQPIRNPEAWLRQVCLNILRSQVDATIKDERKAQKLTTLAQHPNNSLAELTFIEELEHLEDALNSLSSEDQALIRMKFFQRKTYEQIRDNYRAVVKTGDGSVPTVRQLRRLESRALQRLRENFLKLFNT